MKRLYFVRLLGLIGILFFATNIFATPIILEEVGVVPPQIISAHLSNIYDGGVYAGIYELKINGVLTNAYCVEFLQFSPGGPVSYDLQAFPSSSVYKEVAWIMQNYNPATSTHDQVVNAQVAIWEILSKDPGSLQSGDFYVRPWSGSGSLPGAQAIVDTVLKLDLSNFDTTNFNLAHNANSQDYMVENPEPSTMILLGSGLLGLVRLRRKFKK